MQEGVNGCYDRMGMMKEGVEEEEEDESLKWKVLEPTIWED